MASTSNKATDAEHKIKLEVNFKRDSSGTWNLDISRSCSSLSDLMGLLLAKEPINFKGITQEATTEEDCDRPKEKLKFHPRSGSSVALKENSLSAFTYRQGFSAAWAVTNRTLMVDELFEVKLEDQIVTFTPETQHENNYGSAYNYNFYIGVTTLDPISFPVNMEKRPEGWYWSGVSLVKNQASLGNFGKAIPKIGDRIGLLQDASGKLHFFLNGVDQGEYKEKLPYPLYGCIQFFNSLNTATIMDGSTTYGYLLKINS